MKNTVENWLTKNVDSWRNQKYLIGVSGGRDSVALAFVFKSFKIPFRIAHCNYQLRGKASDEDEHFVIKLAKSLNVEYFIKRFETQKMLDDKGGSLQEVARDLRYNWFNELLAEHDIDSICVGTHFNDSAETMLMNLMRGSGLTGLKGIQPMREKILRPLITITREQINTYILSNQLEFREDESNASNKYERNQWRNEIIPLIKETYPHFDSAIKTSLHLLEMVDKIVRKELKRTTQHLIFERDGRWYMNKSIFQGLDPLQYYLYDCLAPFNFNPSIINDLSNKHLMQAGKQFFSPTHFLTVDRQYLIIQANANEIDKKLPKKIAVIDKKINHPISLEFSIKEPGITIQPHQDLAYLDADALTFPLTLRKWNAGDRFRPLGMKGFKKVSDFLIDLKMPLPNKEEQLVLLSKKDIVWVVGQRIDDRYAIKKSTKKIYLIQKINP